MAEDEKVYFDVTISGEDVAEVQRALMKRFEKGKDEPAKVVFLALVVAELEVIMYRGLMGELVTNFDEVIKGLRSQAFERASYIYNKMVQSG